MLSTRKFLLLTRSAAVSMLAAIILCAAPPSAWADGNNGCQSAEVGGIPVPFNPEFGNDIGGHAVLCSGEPGLNGYMRVDNLTEDYAYTVWWVYIDEPVCPGGGFFGCLWTFFGDEPTDFLEFDPVVCGTAIPCIDEEPKAVFGRMDSGISKGGGRLRFANRLNDMQVSPGSQVWMLMFGHGPASDDGRQLARQLLTPEDPASGYPHVGVAPNGYPAAVAIFEMP